MAMKRQVGTSPFVRAAAGAVAVAVAADQRS